MRLCFVGARCPAAILAGRYRLHVGRVNAGAVAAEVIENQSVRNFSNKNRVCSNMSRPISIARHACSAVAVAIAPTTPDPTAGRSVDHAALGKTRRRALMFHLFWHGLPAPHQARSDPRRADEPEDRQVTDQHEHAHGPARAFPFVQLVDRGLLFTDRALRPESSSARTRRSRRGRS